MTNDTVARTPQTWAAFGNSPGWTDAVSIMNHQPVKNYKLNKTCKIGIIIFSIFCIHHITMKVMYWWVILLHTKKYNKIIYSAQVYNDSFNQT